jgi:hypothetical protein
MDLKNTLPFFKLFCQKKVAKWQGTAKILIAYKFIGTFLKPCNWYT